MPSVRGRGAGRGRGRRWERENLKRQPSRWHKTSPAKNDLENDLDGVMQEFMALNDVHNAQLALASKGSVILRRSYTFLPEKEDSPALTKDTSQLLLASCSKIFCAAAIFKLFPSDSDRNTLLMDIPGLEFCLERKPGESDKDYKTRLEQWKAPKETDEDHKKRWEQWGKITLQHLIDHRAGFDSAESGDWTHDARGLAHAVHEQDKTPMVGSVTTAREYLLYMSRWPLDYEPGHPPQTGHNLSDGGIYANIGYVILSRVVEVKSGKDYFKYLIEDLDPSLATKLRNVPTKKADFERMNVPANDPPMITPLSKENSGPPAWDCSKEADFQDVPVEWGGFGEMREACAGSAAIAASATTLAEFIGTNSVWGAGPRNTRGQSRIGSNPGAFAFACSRQDIELDFAFVLNTRSFYDSAEIAWYGDKVQKVEQSIASGSMDNPIHEIITKYKGSLIKT